MDNETTAVAKNPPKRKPRPVSITTTAEMEAKKAAKLEAKKAARLEARKSRDAVKATIVMARDLDFLLGSTADYMGIDRSTLACKFIMRGLKKDHRELFDALLPFTKLAEEASADDDTNRPGG
jgi:hypothetical protein